MDPEYLGIQEAAEKFGVDYKTIYRLVRSGRLPAGKLGGMYRIPRDGLEAYFKSQMAQTAGRELGVDRSQESGVKRCGHCYRLITSPSDLAGACGQAGCDEPICSLCWTTGHRHCALHEPSDRERLTAAQAALARGEIPCLVTAIAARQAETAWISRFDERITSIGSLYHPGTKEVLRIADWMPFHTAEDETLQLMRLLNVGFLDRATQATMPHNEYSRYHIEAGHLGWNRPRHGLVVEARCICHLETHVEQGFDTQPAALDELLMQLADLEVWAKDTSATCIVGLGSPTGWEAAAIGHIASEAGRAYRHPLVLPCLVDLSRGEMYFNRADERLGQLSLTDLFKLSLESEEVVTTRSLVETALLGKEGMSIEELARQLDKPEALVRRACEELVTGGRFRLVREGTLGTVLMRQRN